MAYDQPCIEDCQYEEQLNQQHIGLMFSNQFVRVIETMGATANMISFIAPDDCSHTLFADTRIPNKRDPA
jgi:hypothetical protein